MPESVVCTGIRNLTGLNKSANIRAHAPNPPHTVIAAVAQALAVGLVGELPAGDEGPLLRGGNLGVHARGKVGEGIHSVGGGEAESALSAVNLGLELRGGLCCARARWGGGVGGDGCETGR